MVVYCSWVKTSIYIKLLHFRLTSASSYFLSTLSTIDYHQGHDNFWLAKLDHRDWLAPNELLKIFRNLTNPELVFSAFEKATSRIDYKPTEELYCLLVERFAHARKFDYIEGLLERAKYEKCKLSDDFFYRLIKIFGNVENHPQKAVEALLRMPSFHCWPTVKTFNYVLNMLVCKRQFEVIHEIYLSAPRLGIPLDTCCFNILIKGLCQYNKLDAAFSLLHEIPKQGCSANATTYSTLMHALCKDGRVTEAFELCETMEKTGCYPDTICFNILISGSCKQGRVIEAMELLKTMMLKGCYPNSGTYQALLSGLIDAKMFVEAKKILGVMISERRKPSFSSYKLMIDGLCSENHLDDACMVLKEMVLQGFVPRMGTWNVMLKCMFGNSVLEYDVLCNGSIKISN